MKNKLLNLLVNTGDEKNIAFIDDFGKYSYKDFRESIDKIVGGIKYSAYCRKSNFVVFIENRMLAIASVIALIDCGMVPIPISIETPKELLQQIVQNLDVEGILSIKENDNVEIVMLKKDGINYNDADTMMILLTSGTSGYMKAAELSQEAVLFCVEAVCDYMHTTWENRFFIIKDYTHCSCLISEIFVALARGASICMHNPRQPFSVLRKKIYMDAPTVMGVNPWILEMIHLQKRFGHYYSSVHILVSSGSILSRCLKERICEMLPEARLINVYGMTEASSRICAQYPDGKNDFCSVGKPIRGTEVKIINNDKGQKEIIVKSPGTMLGYYHDMKKTEDKIRNGWIFTGDTGYFDEDGRLIVTGRLDDIILSGANKINSERVTFVLKQAPHVMDAYTAGIADEFLGEKVVSVIVYNKPFDIDERKKVIRFCKKYLYIYEIPSIIVDVKKLPRTTSGKIEKRNIMELFHKIYS